ncbi:hypothetical protein DPSP01_008976 [Paraphaeosphaeria sporulosa]
MGWLSRNPRYGKVAAADSTDELSQATPPPRARTTLLSHLNSLFLIANFMFLSSLVWTARHISSPNYLLKKTNTYTPLLDRFDISFVKTKNNASLFNTPYSIYKDDPSPSVDAAWEEIADTPVLAISREDVVTMGKDPDYVVGIPEEFGETACSLRLPLRCTLSPYRPRPWKILCRERRPAPHPLPQRAPQICLLRLLLRAEVRPRDQSPKDGRSAPDALRGRLAGRPDVPAESQHGGVGIRARAEQAVAGF